MRHLLFVLVSLMLNACVVAPPAPEGGVNKMSDLEYAQLMASATVSTNRYSGFYQTFQADVTMLTSKVQSAILRQRAYYQQLSEKQYLMERQNLLEQNSAYAKFFMRFYTPDRDVDDLQRDKSMWKIYLDYNGQRFEGKVTKLRDKYLQVKTTYPNFDHFSTAYEITFNLPMTTIEDQPCKITLTSSLGVAEFNFPSKK